MLMRKSMLLIFLTALGTTAGCDVFRALCLGVDLLRAVRNAPEGQELCAVFNVIANESNGRRVSALVNEAARATGADVNISASEGETLIALANRLNCEFITCFSANVNELDPPDDEASVPDWVAVRIATLTNIAQTCPAPVNITEEGMVLFIDLMLAVGLSV
jgi:hypothetical protein